MSNSRCSDQPVHAADVVSIAIGEEQDAQVVGVFSAGSKAILSAQEIRPLIRDLTGKKLICFKAAQVHCVLAHHLNQIEDDHGIGLLWGLSRGGRLIDVQILDQLVRLADRGDHAAVRSLQELAEYGFERPNVSALSLPDVAELLVTVYARLVNRVNDIQRRLTGDQAAVDIFGPLGLHIEVQAAIAFDAAIGIPFDQARMQAAIATCETHRNETLNKLRHERQFAGCLDPRNGDYIDGSGFPRFHKSRLESVLKGLIVPLRNLGIPVPIPVVNEEISLNPADWSQISLHDSLLRTWCDLITACQLRHALLDANGSLRPAYKTWPRLHSVGPDLEAARKLELFSNLRSPSGRRFIVLELFELEVSALAAVLDRRNSSRLAQTLRAGDVPHRLLASRLEDVGCNEFRRLHNRHLDEGTYWPEMARCLLREVPRGVGIDGIRIAAETQHAIEMTHVEAARYREVTLETYPEIRDYLRDDVITRLAQNLAISADDLQRLLGVQSDDQIAARLVEIVFEAANDVDSQRIQRELWRLLEASQPRPARSAGELYEMLVQRDYVTPSGQIIGEATPWESHGAAHLFLADAVRKACAYAIAASGERLLALIGDEIIVDLPVVGVEAVSERLADTLKSISIAVLGGIPVVCRCREL